MILVFEFRDGADDFPSSDLYPNLSKTSGLFFDWLDAVDGTGWYLAGYYRDQPLV